VGQEPQLSLRVREILAANGFSGKGIGSSTGSQAPTGSPVQMNPGYQQTVDPNAPTAADAESFFGFSGARQGLSMSSTPTMSPPASQQIIQIIYCIHQHKLQWHLLHHQML